MLNNRQLSCQLNKYDVFLIKLETEIFIFANANLQKNIVNLKFYNG